MAVALDLFAAGADRLVYSETPDPTGVEPEVWHYLFHSDDLCVHRMFYSFDLIIDFSEIADQAIDRRRSIRVKNILS